MVVDLCLLCELLLVVSYMRYDSLVLLIFIAI
jgi:hypothetical protein